ncbi:MAG: hypothetical protein H6Q89_3661, partial [Myxococcaceae bacterium]|nr:hypothetical protein [Myxococcaceae bacterium]
GRLPGFLIAYAAFRARFCVLAAHGCGEADAARWRQAHCGYTEVLRSAVQRQPS